ncbi:MAG: nitrate reductase subunit alpha [Candidatus Thalassarchaeaceae archaeon]|jgi:nitrate reductase alpha subunit|nr:nitrate reductase subunit alpha [Euryarchaeota archaeon]MDP6220027.1 nitrate reductase subunit alpha [Candidatus Thalassarchaeaceae archaeon]MDP7091766.1 nitrate reductase subunit alpha [Candidatus Thalassarchaeaceae archaeon]MDP7256865.1 nitrate reductase subunit alpha [Candidatus Thalassarchaeaceae archaeon]MDP7446105.1 nitrate reductase subunit alpha [Candidatus Thalassarchaeaceae archaeon]|tara:strand:- start:13746 stop:17510 length:3765 start_codon:yes stop_codon:yes gene_type:complete
MSGKNGNGRFTWFKKAKESRTWEKFYRDRWAHDYSVRTSHSVNCSGSCSWEVFVKDGIICWELQKVDWPQINDETPNYEPRGCQRGISASWYPYSPVRPKFPYVRKKLWNAYQRSKRDGMGPVEAWASIVENPELSKSYKKARGKAGWKRVNWDEAAEIVAAGQIYTIKKYGPDHLAAFSPIPAMSMVSFTSGQRWNQLMGGTMLSFYEWYHDLPHIMPWIWGDQTDVAESADWYQGTYWIVMGSNLPMTRTPDAHFASEHKYNGGKITNLSPDYADITKFADLWVQIKEGTDNAFLNACIHVILNEYHHERKTGYFQDYVKQYTNLPFLVMLDEQEGGHHRNGRFLRASDIASFDGEEYSEWKPLQMEAGTNALRIPTGTVGHRWEKENTGRWNLTHQDSLSGEEFDPLLSFIDSEKRRETMVSFPDFTHTYDALGKTEGTGNEAVNRIRGVPAFEVETKDGPVLVTTGMDLLMAQFGVGRGMSGDYPEGYDDADKPFTPAWQEQETGVSRDLAIRVAREWADNAEATEGKSLFITGSGILHWYHGGQSTYRAEAVMGIICGCQGNNGGGFAHYVGTEKIRNYAAIGMLAGATDWSRPPRHANSTSWQYFHTDQWRYDGMPLTSLWAPDAEDLPRHGEHSADINHLAVRAGWLPFYPQFDKMNPIAVYEQAVEAGCESEEEIAAWVAKQFETGEFDFALSDVDAPENHPKVLTIWRGNLFGTSTRGQEYGQKYLLGTHDNVLGGERSQEMVNEVKWHEEVDVGKLDLVVSFNLRMDSSANYADVVLPTAHWYEKHDLTCSDLHSFLHPFNPAHDPPWECKSDWDGFRFLAKKFSEMAADYFSEPIKEVVMTALQTDSPDEMAQPLGEIKDWRSGECEVIPGKTFPNVNVVERDFTKIHDMMTTLGPLGNQPEGYGAKGINFDLSEVYEELKTNRQVGEKLGRPDMTSAKQVAEVILRISPESDGEVSFQIFSELEKRVGLPLADMVEHEREIAHSYVDLSSQPRRSITSPHWSAIESAGRTYGPWTMNVEKLKPWHTLTGRQAIYFDHQAYCDLGEALPTYKPPVDTVAIGDLPLEEVKEGKAKILRFITPHGKWQIHSMFRDTWQMTNLFRGGPLCWLNDEDAAEIGVGDNDWVEVFTNNGIQVARAVTSHTVKRDMCIVYHQNERHVNVPFSPLAKKYGATDLRGGGNNAPTRVMMNPNSMIGGYGQFTYFVNYQGPSPSERDMGVLVRKMPLVDGKPIYEEKDLYLLRGE